MAQSHLSNIKKRKKLLTYGKHASPVSRHENLEVFGEDELSLSHITAKRRRASPQEKTSERIAVKGSARKPDKSRSTTSKFASDRELTERDTFDVPPSDDDDDNIEITLPTLTAPRVRFSSKLVNDREQRHAGVWPEDALDHDQGPARQTREEKARAVPGVHKSSSSEQHSVQSKLHSSASLSASERLRLRQGITKHPAKPEMNNDASSVSKSETSQRSSRQPSIDLSSDHNASGSQYGLGDDSIRRVSGYKSPQTKTRTIEQQSIKGMSLLNGARPGTPRHASVSEDRTTPPPRPGFDTIRSPNLTLTPKQARLWDGLLRRVPSLENSRKDTSSFADKLSREPHHGQRIAERLRMSEKLRRDLSTSESDSDGEGDESGREDLRSPSSSQFQQTSSSQLEAVPSGKRAAVTLQSPGRKRYTQQRSYLASDDLEEETLLGGSLGRSPAGLSRHPKLVEEFDLEDSDGEDKSGGIRSIHELRAAGQSSQMAAATEDLLSDISNHNAAATAPRRLALVRLAAQVLDEAAAKRFLQDGHDRRLAAELKYSGDAASTSLLLSIFLTLLAVEPAANMLERLRTHLPHLLSSIDQHDDVQSLLRNRSGKGTLTFLKETAQYFKQILVDRRFWADERPGRLTPRLLGLGVIDSLIHQLRRIGDNSQVFDTDAIAHLSLSMLETTADNNQSIDRAITISILESLSISADAIAWPPQCVSTIASLLAGFDATTSNRHHFQSLLYRLCLNITNNSDIDHFIFAKNGSVPNLLRVITSAFDSISRAEKLDPQQRTVQLELLVLAIGIMINLTEHSKAVRQATLSKDVEPLLLRILSVFRERHETARDIDSEDETASNVAYGYLAVLLANLCQDADVRQHLSKQLPGQSLRSLEDAVEEFVLHHRRVDSMHFEGEEGQQVWSSFTARLEDVLRKLRSVVNVS